MKGGCLLELRKTLRYSAFSLHVISALLVGPTSRSLPSGKRDGHMRKQFQCHMETRSSKNVLVMIQKKGLGMSDSMKGFMEASQGVTPES